MILQALVKEYESLAEQGKVSQPGWCQANYLLEAGKRNWEKEGFNSQNDESTADGHPIFWNSGKFSV